MKEKIEQISKALGNEDQGVLAEYGGFNEGLQRLDSNEFPEEWVTEGRSKNSLCDVPISR